MSSTDPPEAVRTATGQRVRPADPDPERIRLEDIAHGLAHLCRCSGQTRFFYSVALHSIHVGRELAARDARPLVQLYGLLHDAPEAYLSDVAAPVKAHLDGYRELEARVADAVWAAFDVPPPSGDDAERLREADLRVREYELSVLLPDYPEPDVRPAREYDLRADEDLDVAARFQERARELCAESGVGSPPTETSDGSDS